MFPEKEITEYAKGILEDRGNGAHTFDHSIRVLQICKSIMNKRDANVRVLGAAALLHDIGRPFEEETGESHSIISGRMSEEFLLGLGYSEAEVNEVLSAIRTHRFSEGLEPTSLEGKILSDADKLDAIGAIGVFRAIAQAAVSQRGIKGFLDHAQEKLLRLKNLLYTEEAGRIGRKRHDFLESFVERLKQETTSD